MLIWVTTNSSTRKTLYLFLRACFNEYKVRKSIVNQQKEQIQGTLNNARQNKCSTQQIFLEFEVVEGTKSGRHCKNCNGCGHNV